MICIQVWQLKIVKMLFDCVLYIYILAKEFLFFIFFIEAVLAKELANC
jgi:hypothetical protein